MRMLAGLVLVAAVVLASIGTAEAQLVLEELSDHPIVALRNEWWSFRAAFSWDADSEAAARATNITVIHYRVLRGTHAVVSSGNFSAIDPEFGALKTHRTFEVKDASAGYHRYELQLALAPNFTSSDTQVTSLSFYTHVIYGGLSLLPPLFTIATVVGTRNVLLSLYTGVFTACFIVYRFNPVAAFSRSFDTLILDALSDRGHAEVILFTWFLSGMVACILKSGGGDGLVRAFSKFAHTPRAGSIITVVLGLLIFFDGIANTLIVGQTVRPITDTLRISREKLAFLVDATSSPVTSVSPISTWVGFELSLIENTLRDLADSGEDVSCYDSSAFVIFVKTIPGRFYPFIVLALQLMLIVVGREFGPMLMAERRARAAALPSTEARRAPASMNGTNTTAGGEQQRGAAPSTAALASTSRRSEQLTPILGSQQRTPSSTPPTNHHQQYGSSGHSSTGSLPPMSHAADTVTVLPSSHAPAAKAMQRRAAEQAGRSGQGGGSWQQAAAGTGGGQASGGQSGGGGGGGEGMRGDVDDLDLSGGEEELMQFEPDPETPRRWWNAAVPVAVTTIVVLISLVVTGVDASRQQGLTLSGENIFGNSDSYHALLYGSVVGTLTVWLLACAQRVDVAGNVVWFDRKFKPLLSLKQSLDTWVAGVRSLTFAVLILLLAWSVGAAFTMCGTAEFVSASLAGSVSAGAYPALTFMLSGLLAFVTGSSWGTMGIVFPLILPAAHRAAPCNERVFYGTVASILAGAVFGDHCSPISDTTILSSIACRCNLTAHVITQAPYAVLAGVCSFLLGDLPVGFGAYPDWVGLVLSVCTTLAAAYALSVPVENSAKMDGVTLGWRWVRARVLALWHWIVFAATGYRHARVRDSDSNSSDESGGRGAGSFVPFDNPMFGRGGPDHNGDYDAVYDDGDGGEEEEEEERQKGTGKQGEAQFLFVPASGEDVDV